MFGGPLGGPFSGREAQVSPRLSESFQVSLVIGLQLNTGGGRGVEHAATQIFPVGLEDRGVRQEVSPRIARHRIGGRNDVELAILKDLTDQNRLGEVVVRQHLSGTAGQVGKLLTIHFFAKHRR